MERNNPQAIYSLPVIFQGRRKGKEKKTLIINSYSYSGTRLQRQEVTVIYPSKRRKNNFPLPTVLFFIILFYSFSNRYSNFFIFLLKYSWFTMLDQFLLYSKVTKSYRMYTFLFLDYLPSCSIWRYWMQFPVLYSRTSLLICSKCNHLHLLSPQSPSILFPLPSLLATTSLFSMSVSPFLSHTCF